MSVERNQIENKILKSELGEIENAIAKQHASAHEWLNKEDLSTELDATVAEHRRLNQEHEALTKEGVCLVARRMEVKRNSDQLTIELEDMQQCRKQLIMDIDRTTHEVCAEITEYEDTLLGIADRFRKTSIFCDIELMHKKIEEEKVAAVEAETEMRALETFTATLEAKLGELVADWPDDMLDIFGKSELEERLRQVTEECEELQKNTT